MLERILRFTYHSPVGRGPGAATAAAAQAGAAAAAAPSWRSAWPLTDGERLFVEAVLEHRGDKLLLGAAVEDKKPIPPGLFRRLQAACLACGPQAPMLA
jgi:hypothetical protein